MSPLRFVLAFIAAWWRVLLRRRAAPGWSTSQQALVDTMRRHGKQLMALPPAEARRRGERLQAVAPTPRGVGFHAAAVAGHAVLRVVPRRVEHVGVRLLYFHGGGYVFGSPRSYRAGLASLARALGMEVWAPTYRLAPDHRFPAAVDDASEIMASVMAEHGAGRWLVGGDSAGGALAIAACLAVKDAPRRPCGLLLLSPWVDLAARGGSVESNAAFDWGDAAYLAHWAGFYLGPARPEDPRASPVFADLAGLPAVHVEVGGRELLHDQVQEFAARARAAGVAVELVVEPGAVHGWWMLGPTFDPRAALARLHAAASGFPSVEPPGAGSAGQPRPG